ncbi:MAG TPA: histidine kinase dimerization/phospho-acceptor domain-containing protein, partial [bacterium]|nr:histidine kinase dimerization/phospho-acceptor domain-containing protein [bacterium]
MRLKIILLFIVLLIISLEAGLLIYYGIDRYTENIENFESENIKNIFEYFELSIRNFDELKTMTDYFTKKTEVLSKIILENIHQLKFFTDNFKNNANIDKMLISNYVGKILYNSNFEKSVNIDTIVFQDTIIRNIVFKDTEIYAVYSAPIKYSDKIVGAILVHKRISENFINRFEINNNIKIFRATTTDNQPYFDDTDFFIKIDFSNVYVSKKIKDIDGNILTFTFVRNLNPIKTAMYKTNRYFIKINLIIVGFVFLIGYIIIHLFSKNLKRIAEAADKIAAGEYHIQLKKNAVKEINSVIQSFNKMSSDLKKTQDYIIQQEKLYLAGKLASGMAHELNNPLVAALGYTQMLLESKNLQDQKIQNYLKQIEANILRARTIVKSVRSYSTFT